MIEERCPREDFFISFVKKISKGKTNKERRQFRRAIKEAKKDGSYPALVNEVIDDLVEKGHEVLDDLVEKGHACPSFHSTAT